MKQGYSIHVCILGCHFYFLPPWEKSVPAELTLKHTLFKYMNENTSSYTCLIFYYTPHIQKCVKMHNVIQVSIALAYSLRIVLCSLVDNLPKSETFVWLSI